MNSLNVLAHIGNTPPPSPPRSRASSEANISQTQRTRPSNNAGADSIASQDSKGNMAAARAGRSAYPKADSVAPDLDEKSPLLTRSPSAPYPEAQVSRAWLIPKRISEVVIGTIKALVTTVIAPGAFVVACFYDDEGKFSALSPVYKIARSFSRKGKNSGKMTEHPPERIDINEKGRRKGRGSSVSLSKTRRPPQRSPSIASSSTAITSDSELESDRRTGVDDDGPSRHTRSRSSLSTGVERVAPAERTMHIRLTQPDEVRQRKKKSSFRNGSSKGGSTQISAEAAAALKSPTSPATVSSKQLTKFPRAPQPPRPLVPRRQPSYSTTAASAVGPYQKTLIIDLDETLIHSMSKGGRYTTGHMVEVKLQQPVGTGGQTLGPQIPILYYVHFRPHCDEFLKKVFRADVRYILGANRGCRFVNGTTSLFSRRQCKSMRTQ